jgi:hypothetical protein
MRHARIKLNKCRVIFFDLEFYVPESSRCNDGFCYNPWDKNCKILGGSFLSARPDKDFGIAEEKISRKIQSLWLWNSHSEKKLLESIYNYLKRIQETTSNAHEGKISAVLCGIGITSSDIPILFDLFKRYKILSNTEAFSFQNKFRVVDLSQLSIATFNNSNNFLYPNSKNNILNKYMNGKTFESGKIVWELYESKSYDQIASRVIDEIISTHKCYELIKCDIDNFKKLEARVKRLERTINKDRDGLT